MGRKRHSDRGAGGSALWGGAVLLALAAAAAGQVALSQDGRTLDASYGLGTGGFNSVRQSNRAFDGNLYVTGQVGGGFFAFHGTTPYAGANQLNLSLPTADLDAFIRQSVGVQYAGNPVYGPRPYLSSYQTVLNAGNIASGLNAPGTSIPRSAYVPAAMASQFTQIYQTPMEAYKPLLPPGYLQRAPATSAESLEILAQAAAAGAGAPGAVRPVATELFGLVRETDQQNLAREIVQGGAALATEEEPAPDSPLQPVQPRAGPDQPARSSLLRPGQDVFYDVLVRLNRMRRETPPTELGPEHPQVRRTPEPEEDQDQTPSYRPRPAPVERTGQNLVLHSLAGNNQDLFNLHMAKAEKLMALGKFYDAAGEYRVAHVLVRENPLALLGSAVALLGAQEPMSASGSLYQAMSRFPPLMETRLDLARLLTAQVAQDRLEQLDKRIARDGDSPEPALLFLAAFMRASAGQTEKAQALAGRLNEFAGGDPIYVLYAQYVLTGKLPSTQPAKPPAYQPPPARLGG